VFNKEKREEKRQKAKETKETLKRQIKPRPTFEQRQKARAKASARKEAEDELNSVVVERLNEIHSGGATGTDVVQLGADLHYLSSFSGLHIQIKDHINGPEGRVVTRWTVRGKHDRDFLGIPPTGREVSFGGTSLCFLKNDAVTQESHYWDVIGLLQQIQS
jgi:predicted ester cyclase